MARPDPFGLDDVFTTLFSRDPGEIDAAGHPPDEALQAYRAQRAGSGRSDPAAWLARIRGESAEESWSRQAITAHLMTCEACRERLHQMRAAPEPSSSTLAQRIRDWTAAVRGAFQPMPRPAMAAMAAQSVVIIGLAAALLLGPLGIGQPSAPSSEMAQATSSAPSEPQAQAQSVPPDGQSREAAGDNEDASTAEASLPEPMAERIRILSNSSDPEARLVAARELQNWSDPSLVPELTRLYRQESHPQVQQALRGAINAIASNMATQYDSALQAIREFEGSTGLQASELMDQVERRLGQLFSEAGPSMPDSGGAEYAGSLVCTASAGLTLSQLRRLSDELGGMMVVDHSLPSESFRMRLPISAGLNETLRGLESDMDLRCYQE